MRKKTKPAALLCAMLIFMAQLLLPAAAAEKPWGLLLSPEGDMQTSMTFTWRGEKTDASRLELSKEQSFEAALSFPARCRDISLDGSGVWLYEVRAEGLEPGTKYYYRAGTPGAWLEGSFSTEKAQATSASFAFFGDIQPDFGRDDAVFSAWAALAGKAQELYPGLSLAVLGGDIVSSGISVKQFDAFRRNVSPALASLPVAAAAGNQESNFISGKPELLLGELPMPKNGPEGFEGEFYCLDLGPCRVVVINGWVFSGEQRLADGDMDRLAAWLELSLLEGGSDWQVVVSHLPLLPLHDDENAEKLASAWAPIIERCGADLVLEGHQHVYSRSVPVSGGEPSESGLVYIMGNSGEKFYYSSDESLSASAIYGKAACQVVSAGADTLSVETMDAAGELLDAADIARRAADVTRGEVIDVMWRYAGSPAPKNASPFADAESTSAAWVAETGIALGFGDGTLRPEQTVTAEQLSLLFERYTAAGCWR